MKHCTQPLRRCELLPTTPDEFDIEVYAAPAEPDEYTHESYAREQCDDHNSRRIPGNY